MDTRAPSGDELREKLAGEKAVTDWRSLGPHHERQALFLVSGDVDLLDAAVAVAGDDSAAVAAWLAQGALARPTDDEAARWADEPDTTFAFVIVQPYVVAALT